jgi:Hemerythrin HHE cation binding domain
MSIVNKVKSLSARATMTADDVRALLAKDHDEAKALAKEMHEAGSAARRKTLLSKLKPVLTAHSRAEEKVVYDALLRVRASDESHEIADEGYVEHSIVDELLATLASSDASTERWRATAKVLHELLEHHIQEEETDTFALLGDHFDRSKLEELGAQFKRMEMNFLEAEIAAPKRSAAPRRAPAKSVRRATKTTASARGARKSASK